MDHGPFSAVELLQQIASGRSSSEHVLRDVFSGEERFIKDWDEFAPFAEQAKLNRDISQEKQAARGRRRRREARARSTRRCIGVAVLGVFARRAARPVAARSREPRRTSARCRRQGAVSIDVDGGLGAGKKPATGPGGGGGPRPAARPAATRSLAGGMSCEGARAQVRRGVRHGHNGPPDLTRRRVRRGAQQGQLPQLAAACPSSMAVNICAAVQNGRAVGVTVTTTPVEPGHLLVRRGRGPRRSPSRRTRGSTSPRTTFAAN